MAKSILSELLESIECFASMLYFDSLNDNWTYQNIITALM